MSKLTKAECVRRLNLRQECTDTLTHLARVEHEVSEIRDRVLRIRTDVLGDDLHDYCTHCANWNENPEMCAACGCYNTATDKFYFTPEQYEH